MSDDKKLEDVLGGKVEGAELHVKDLGPQVSWRMVFLVEYVRIDHFTLVNANNHDWQ